MASADGESFWLVENGDYWRVTWVTPDGSRKSKSLGHKSKLSRRQARVKARAVSRGDGTATGVPRLSAWIDRFIETRAVGERTKATYREAAHYLRRFFDNDPPIDKISRAEAAEWRDSLASGGLTQELNELAKTGDAAAKNGAGRDWRPPVAATVARHVRAAKLIFGEAVERDLIGSNPFGRLNGTPPRPLKDWRQVGPDEMAKILAACPSEGFCLLFALCRWSGLRLGEALRLSWDSVDLAANQIRVNADISAETTKARRRVAPVEPARCPTGLLALLTAARMVPAGPLVCHGVSANNIRRDALAVLRRSGVGRYAKPFHTLRKCCETDWAQQYPQSVVSEWIGHDIAVSQAHYLRVPVELYALPPAPSVQIGHDVTR